MTTKGSKAKGRRFQQEIAALFNTLLDGEFVQSNPMGLRGSDIIDGQYKLPFSYIECRNREQWPNLNEVNTEMGKAMPGWLFCIRKNRTEPIFVMDKTAFLRVMEVCFSML